MKKNRNKHTYKVTVTATGRVVAYATKDPAKLMQAIEINKHKRSRGMRSTHKRNRNSNKTKKVHH